MTHLTRKTQTDLAWMTRGALSFAAVSLGGFSLWAFWGRWFYQNVGEAGLYVASTVVFVVLAGLLMHPLVLGERRIARFYKAFIPAFLAYAFVWSVCWFIGKSGLGEWLGSLLGCAVFAWITGKMLGSTKDLVKVTAVLFVGHSAGYFLGGVLYMSRAHPDFLGLSRQQIGLLGRLLWGLLYGLGFGAGIGYAFARFQDGVCQSPPPEPTLSATPV